MVKMLVIKKYNLKDFKVSDNVKITKKIKH